ncbi:phage baseplate protein [Neisseria sp. Dent CA1/247]|uniref:Gp138 family membrane-puncturing spike protein n=1 Tax=Neisseria sp. Dent CA1/247 TaxID=2912675 RepID=UPI001FD0E548|nr:Gp138 family membrane-puncturing spike protein [Neisseria sp. Dent CA1/247]UOO77918.1 phage baseplate protein [Neisseria sp. Dent CA1/247]
MSQNKAGYEEAGQRGGTGEVAFIVESILTRIQTVTLVRVVKVKGGGLAPVGMVDVQPLVSQVDASGGVIPHGVIYNVPYMRLQGGSNAVIIDPQPGDIGMCGFCSRDISNVKAFKKPAAPHSKRKFDFSDGLYFGGFLNGTPEQYIMFSDGGIKMFSPKEIQLEAPKTLIKSPDVKIDGAQMTIKANTTQNGSFSQTGGGAASFSGNVAVRGNANVSEKVEAGIDVIGGGKSLKSHTNGGLAVD